MSKSISIYLYIVSLWSRVPKFLQRTLFSYFQNWLKRNLQNCGQVWKSWVDFGGRFIYRSLQNNDAVFTFSEVLIKKIFKQNDQKIVQKNI